MTVSKDKIHLIRIFLLVFTLSAILNGCGNSTPTQDPEPITETGFYLNTVVSITIYDSSDTSLLTESLNICKQYEDQLSRTIPTSEISRLNNGELTDEQGISHLSADTAKLIQEGLSYAELSDGAFDITIGPVSSLWDFTSEDPSIPDDADIQAKLPLVGYKKVALDGESIHFDTEGMQLDLGAIAKGYIADRIKDHLVSKDVKSAIINLGGNVLCIGEKPDGTPFKIGVQKPFADRNETITTVDVSDYSVVSSGIYERHFEKDGRNYHHILDPSTGYPYDNGLTSVTILSPTSTEGDGLSTTCFALGLDAGMALINETEDVEAAFISSDGKIHYSSGFPRT
ncbi:MAG: FAD:protein FMN transferase [Clostridia bacterium]|nr:FAD:protein FMN transferase [Clostridia bacterium]